MLNRLRQSAQYNCCIIVCCCTDRIVTLECGMISDLFDRIRFEVWHSPLLMADGGNKEAILLISSKGIQGKSGAGTSHELPSAGFGYQLKSILLD